MKKLLLLSILLMTGTVFASGPVTVVRSSFTKTNDTAVCLSSAAYLTGVNVSAASNAGSIAIYNSSWTTGANLLITSVSLTNIMPYAYYDMPVAGICYTAAVNTNGVQILYRR